MYILPKKIIYYNYQCLSQQHDSFFILYIFQNIKLLHI